MRFTEPDFSELEETYLLRAMQSGQTSGAGDFGSRAEAVLSHFYEGRPSLLVTSCTHALEMSAMLLEIGPSDEVIVPSFAFVSAANAFALRGARIVFADVNPLSLSLSVDTVEGLISKKTRAICVVNYGGAGAGLAQLRELCDSRGLWLVEDNAHGIFTTYRGQKLGSFGHISVSSFHQTKNLVCGEGGAIVLNDERFLQRAEILREKGTDRSDFFRGQVDKYSWRDIGSSWVISDLLAAVLCAQFERRKEILGARDAVWDTYFEALETWAGDVDVRFPPARSELQHSSHIFPLIFPTAQVADSFIRHLRERGIPAVFHYQPLHLSPFAERHIEGGRGTLPVTEWAASGLVRLPLHSKLRDSEVGAVIEAVLDFDPHGKR